MSRVTDHSKERAERRARARAERDKARRDRSFALRAMARLAGNDETISGFTLFSPGGDVEYIDAERLRTGGRA